MCNPRSPTIASADSLHILSDLGISSAFLILAGLVALLLLWGDLPPFRKLVWLFSAFLLACGITHLLEAISGWRPASSFHGAMKLATALVAWTTIAFVCFAVPKVLALRSRQEMEREIAHGRQAQDVATNQMALLDLARDAIFVRDMDLRITFWNKGAEEIYGYSRAEAVGRIASELLRTEFPTTHQAILEELEQEGRWEGELIHTRRDGTRLVIASRLALERDEAGRAKAMMAINTDITQRKQAEERLREKDRRYQAIFDASFKFTWILRPDGVLIEANQTALDFGGLTQADVVGTPFCETPWWSSPSQAEQFREGVARASAGEFVCAEEEMSGAGGVVATVEMSFKPVLDEGGHVVLLLCEGRDITDMKKAQRALQESEERFRNAFDHAPGGMFITALDARWLKANLALCVMLGRSEEELFATTWEALTHPDDLAGDQANAERLLKGEIRFYHMEKRYLHRDGRTLWALLGGALVRDPLGKPLYFVGHVLDITERKQTEERLRTSLEEKRVLLREIHHRVKNNLQVISSLLDLQAQYTTDDNAIGMFRESRNRVRAMALVHELLYQTELLANIDFGEYLRNLVGQLASTYQVGECEVRFELELEPIHLSIDTAVPCGLIVNELVSNCLKYAFPGRRNGLIRLYLGTSRRQPDPDAIDPPERDTVILRVADDGVGMPTGVGLDHARTFGLRLITALVEQMHGRAEILSRPGTMIQITFTSSR